MKFSIKDFFDKWDQSRRKLRIWPHLLKKFLMENSIFCAVFGNFRIFALSLTLSFTTLRNGQTYFKKQDF